MFTTSSKSLKCCTFYNPRCEVWNTVVSFEMLLKGFFLHLLHKYLGNIARSERDRDRERVRKRERAKGRERQTSLEQRASVAR